MLDPHDVVPADFILGFGRIRFHSNLGSGFRRGAVLSAFVRQESKGHAEDVDVLWVKQPGFPTFPTVSTCAPTPRCAFRWLVMGRGEAGWQRTSGSSFSLWLDSKEAVVTN